MKIFKNILTVVEKKEIILWTIIILIPTLFIIIFFIHPSFLQNITGLHQPEARGVEDEYTWLYYTLICLLTSLIAYFSYYRLTSISDQTKDDFLIKIDEEWGSNQKTRGRILIHEICLEVGAIYDQYHKAGEKIVELSQSKKNAAKFVHIMNVLNFMEAIGYLHNKKEHCLNKKDLQELFGESIKINYKIFEPYIKHARLNRGSENLFKEFETMYLELNDTSK